MPDRTHQNREAPAPPSRVDVRQKLEGLLSGAVTRDEANSWAMQWVAARDPGVDDRAVWQALNALGMADSPTTDRQWLFEEVDFRAWLAEFEAACSD